ncbi:MAG: hypothetical protein A2Y24_04335 [Clostridiales bacterium GWE2_32_10]|nr:MAG: hypothetical protein A2Y24_04335 [Clostridiales bacterium GWE2_32_10]HBY20441.1 hypothetical protein [Clostridiales bacterium]
MGKKMLGEILLEENLIDSETLRIALEKQKQYALTDVSQKDKVPIPYVIQPDWRIAWFFKLALLPLLVYFLAKMYTMPENFPTLLVLLIIFLVMDLVVIRHTYVQKLVLFEEKFIYRGLHIVDYSSIVKIDTSFVWSGIQIGYRVKVYTKDRENPVWINISFFDNTDLKILFSVLEKQGIKIEMNEFSKKLKEGKSTLVETDLLKWSSLILGIFILIIIFWGISKIMFS